MCMILFSYGLVIHNELLSGQEITKKDLPCSRSDLETFLGEGKTNKEGSILCSF